MVLSGTAPGITQSALPDSIPRCEGIREATPAAWQEVVFDRVTLRVPEGFVPSSRIVGIDHGGREWIRREAAVRVINGFFGLNSFSAQEGTRCMADIRGRQVLLIERASTTGVSLLAWYPSLGPMFEANNTRPSDLRMLRQVLLSANAQK